MDTRYPIVILAGGPGSRIGGGKPIKMLAGVSLLMRAVAKAERYSSPIAVSVSGPTLRLPDNVHPLQDEAEMQGPIVGLATALKFASTMESSHVMIMPCDTPFLPENLFHRLCNSIGASFAAVAKYDGWMHPACSLWRADAAELLPDYLANGRRSLIGFAETVGCVAVEWRKEPVDPFLNINTAEELDRAEAILSQP
jgi:molybdenum cofactor guanylyltransferase